MTFLQIYKKIDILLKDAYQCDNGVSTYIDMLDESRYLNWYGIDWESVYHKLKKYRHIRNQIAHDDVDESALYDNNDLCG